jgi:hypothetical protein
VLSLDVIKESLDNGRNLFVTNKPDVKEALITVDIDPDKDGFSQNVCEHACLMMAKYVCDLYPGSAHEPSTNGTGRHVRLRLDTEGWAVPETQERLKHLEARLNSLSVLCQPGIKQVEVKQTVSSHKPDEK